MPKERRDKARRHVAAAGASSLPSRSQSTQPTALPTEYIPASAISTNHAALDAVVQGNLAAALAAQHVHHTAIVPQSPLIQTALADSSASRPYRQRRKVDKRADRHNALLSSQTAHKQHSTVAVVGPLSTNRPIQTCVVVLCCVVLWDGRSDVTGRAAEAAAVEAGNPTFTDSLV